MKAKVKNIGIGVILMLLVGLAMWNGGEKLLWLFTILNNKETTLVSNSKKHCIGGGDSRSAAGGCSISFSFTADGKIYNVTSSRFEEEGYHYTRLWEETGMVKNKEKFEVTYCKEDPYLCIPTKYINKTLWSNSYPFLLCLIAPLFVYISRKNRAASQKKETS